MSKSFALAAFNAAVAITNAGHATKRGVVAAASCEPGAHRGKSGNTKPFKALNTIRTPS